jgi:hypothetical protein
MTQPESPASWSLLLGIAVDRLVDLTTSRRIQ